jgi:hypothetical protein
MDLVQWVLVPGTNPPTEQTSAPKSCCLSCSTTSQHGEQGDQDKSCGLPLACLVCPSFPCRPTLLKLNECGNFRHGVVNFDGGWYALHSQRQLLLGLLIIEPLLTFSKAWLYFCERIQGTHRLSLSATMNFVGMMSPTPSPCLMHMQSSPNHSDE